MKRTTRYLPDRLGNRYFIYCWLITFALQVGQNTYNSTMSVYAHSLGLSNAFAGSLFMPYLICAVIGRVLSGLIADARGRRLAMVLGCGAFLFGSVLFNIPKLAVLPFVMMMARGVHGFGYACANTAYSVASVDVTPPEKLSVGVGINWTAQGLAMALNGIFIAVLVTNDDYTVLFLTATALLIVSMLFSALCNYEGPGTEKRERKRITVKGLVNDMFERTALPYAFAALFFYLGVAALSLFSLAAAESRGIPHAGLFYTAGAVGSTACNIFLVRLQKRFGTLRVLLPVFFIMALSDVILSFCTTLPLFLLAGLFYGIGLGMMPVLQSETVRHLPVLRRGAGTSTLFLAMDLGMGIGPTIWGIVSDAAGFTVSYALSAGCILLSMVLLTLVFRRWRPRYDDNSSKPI